jgi:hypothetical protein
MENVQRNAFRLERVFVVECEGNKREFLSSQVTAEVAKECCWTVGVYDVVKGEYLRKG